MIGKLNHGWTRFSLESDNTSYKRDCLFILWLSLDKGRMTPWNNNCLWHWPFCFTCISPPGFRFWLLSSEYNWHMSNSHVLERSSTVHQLYNEVHLAKHLRQSGGLLHQVTAPSYPQPLSHYSYLTPIMSMRTLSRSIVTHILTVLVFLTLIMSSDNQPLFISAPSVFIV